MIGYVTLGTNDLQRAAAFYDALLIELGAKRLWEFGTGIGWGTAQDKPSLAIMKPYDGKAATVGNGLHPFVREREVGDPSPQRGGGWTDFPAEQYLEGVSPERDLLGPAKRLLDRAIFALAAAA